MTRTPQQRDRLLGLEAFLRSFERRFPADAFNMDMWLDCADAPLDDDDIRHDLRRLLQHGQRQYATAACPLGWASILYRDFPADFQKNPLLAAQRFFGLSHQQSMTLFLPGTYPEPRRVTPLQVADRVADMLRVRFG